MKLLSLFILLVTLLPCLSQKEKASVTCRVVFLERPDNAPNKAFLFDGASSHEVSLSGMGLSNVVKLSSGTTAIGLTQNRIDDPELFPQGAPKVNIPVGVTDLYLLVLSDTTNKVFPAKLLVVDASDNQLRPGETLWINLSKNTIVGKLGDQTVKLAPGKKAVGKPPMSKSGYYKAKFSYMPLGQNEFYPVMNKTWWLDTTSKYLGFVTNTNNRLPKIFALRDQRLSEKEANESKEQ